MHKLKYLGLAALAATLALAPSAQANHVPAQPYTGNPDCEDFGYTTITKFEGGNLRAGATRDGITLTAVNIGGGSVSWTSTVAVDAVLVKGGPGGNLYEYQLDTFSDTNLVTQVNNENGGRYGLSHVEFCTDGDNEPEPKPGIHLDKVGPTGAYAGDKVTYTFTVTNTGDQDLFDVDLSDAKCEGPITITNKSQNQDNVLDVDEVWTFTCQYTVKQGETSVTNTAEVCAENEDEEEVCDEDNHQFPVKKIEIDVTKTGVQQSAVAGTTVTFTITVKNTGNTDIAQAGLDLDDETCGPLTRTGANAGDTVLNPNETWTFSCSQPTEVGDEEACNEVKATGTNADGKSDSDMDDACIPLTPPPTDIVLDKTGVLEAWEGETVTYSFKVTNVGDQDLSNVVLTDTKCASAPVRDNATDVGSDNILSEGEFWTYTCQYQVPAGVNSVENDAEVCADDEDMQNPAKVCAEDDWEFPVKRLALGITKTNVEATAQAGATVNFTITVTNTGNVDIAMADVVVNDASCTPVRTGATAGDTVLDAPQGNTPGDTWTYSCAVATQVGMTEVCNTATATGTVGEVTFTTQPATACIPLTQPPTTPTTPGGGGGGVLPEETLSGLARLRGPSGCVKQAFRARVTGREIASVTFKVDGKVVKRITGERDVYAAKIRPNAYGFGRHRVVARVTFSAESGTAARTLRLTFRRCARGQVAPRFTG